MKRIALILAFSMLAAIAVAAQDKPKADTPKADAAKSDAKPAALPTVDEVLDKFVKALGGREAVEKITSRSVKGSFEIEAMNMTGTLEMAAKAPNKSATKVDIPGFGVVNNVFDGAKAWATDPMQGLRELSGGELAAMKRRSDFYAEINYKKIYPKMEMKGKEKVGSYETYVIEATPAEGGPEKLYFDVNTGLLVRQDMEVEGPQGKMATESYMDDYKVVDGVKVAHTMKQVNPMFAMTMKFTEVKTNVPIDDAKFNKPSN
ncbi:MAG: hypothetical protein JMDDDDMK_01777 [Acidobacteria bacterium]|nr:hypothetical protein [Acidobacteriota bacterium]